MMENIKITLPKNGEIYLVFDTDENQDKLIGDNSSIAYFKDLFRQAERRGLTYTWYDVTTPFIEKIKADDFLNCDAIKAVLIHYKIPRPSNLCSSAERERQIVKNVFEIDVLY